jgi:K+/H+ antiporter YhaU regulatory subunit KhtT
MSFYKELFIALSLFLLVFLIGVFGFYWVAPEANWLEALTTSYGDAASSIAEIEIDHLTPVQQGKTLSELGLRQETGCNVIGYIQPNSPPVINPSAHQKIALGATLIVLGTQEAHEKLRRMFSA